ncbi:MAG: prolyl oligopeptidase family serine peptidase [Syntrophobacteraceae bacterium]|nr:prolyl oligopeptidase family serine peptidase [Syntrophobacteraceae bacterium]
MARALAEMPGVACNFTQPMAMRLDEVVSGVKADVAVKVFGPDPWANGLKANGIAVEWLLFEDEGHWITREENRIRFHRALEHFLATHLKNRGHASVRPVTMPLPRKAD